MHWTKAVPALAAVLALAACDNGPSAVAKQEPVAEPAASTAPQRQASAGDPRTAPIPRVDGKPMWSANRRYTATENAARHFARNGEAFGAKDVDDYVKKAHAFVSAPPRGAETLTRPNGDLLIYDARSNVFAVATAEGAPRTMFKPDDGRAYWDRQKEREGRRAANDNDGDNG